jgi:transcriptional regulator with XRE-family HTH domain
MKMENVAETIRQRIRQIRVEKGVSQVRLGELTGLDQAYVSRLENGTAEGTPSQLYAIAKALGVGIAYLYGETDEKGENRSTGRQQTG